MSPSAYRLAVAGLGLALFAFVVGAGVAVSLGVDVPDKFWLLGTSLAGILAGLLVPPPTATGGAPAGAAVLRAQQDALEAQQQARIHLESVTAAAALAPAPAGATPAGGPQPAAVQVDPSRLDASKRALDTAIANLGKAIDAQPYLTIGVRRAVAWASANFRFVVLGSLFAVCGIAALVLDNLGTRGATQLYAVAAAAGATLLGLLAPNPRAEESAPPPGH
jgi:hypothetical protein